MMRRTRERVKPVPQIGYRRGLATVAKRKARGEAGKIVNYQAFSAGRPFSGGAGPAWRESNDRCAPGKSALRMLTLSMWHWFRLRPRAGKGGGTRTSRVRDTTMTYGPPQSRIRDSRDQALAGHVDGPEGVPYKPRQPREPTQSALPVPSIERSVIARRAETTRETDLPAQQIGAQAPTRFSRPNGDQRRSQGPFGAPRARAQASQCLIGAALPSAPSSG